MRLWLVPILLLLAPFVIYGFYLAVAGGDRGPARTIRLLVMSALMAAGIGAFVMWQLSEPKPEPIETDFDDGRGVYSPPVELPRPDDRPARDG